MTFLVSEDEALRNLLLGMTVTDQKAVANGSPRNVKVYFGQPSQEVVSQSYPYIVIDMIDIAEDTSRAMRGMVKPNYLNDPTYMVQPVQGTQSVQAVQGVSYDSETNDWMMHWPIPVNIDYQVTTYAREPRHDRQILGQILTTKIPMRFAILEPDDGTVRRLDLLDISKRDVTEQGKRLFVNALTVRVSSEITEATYNQVYKALQINVTGPDDAGSQVIGRSTWTPISYNISQP